MITADGWFDWAVRRPGPAFKVNGWNNPADLFLPHSAVGNDINGWYTRLDDPNDRASVHGWINKDGSLIQHYPLTAECWASGSSFPNNHGVAFEHQGGAPGNESEPLTEGQIAADLRILRELAAWKGRPLTYWLRPISAADLGATLYEHRECTRFGSLATACPSGRIPWAEILRRLQTSDEEITMAKHVTISDKERGAHDFRSYIIQATAAGFSSRWVRSSEEYVAADLALGPMTIVPLAVLRSFHPDPDPLT